MGAIISNPPQVRSRATWAPELDKSFLLLSFVRRNHLHVHKGQYQDMKNLEATWVPESYRVW